MREQNSKQGFHLLIKDTNKAVEEETKILKSVLEDFGVAWNLVRDAIFTSWLSRCTATDSLKDDRAILAETHLDVERGIVAK